MKKQHYIVFSNRAYNSILSETYDKIQTETGGILLGRIIDDVWYVIEVIDPGPNSVFTFTYFEYDTPYVNHLAKAISKQYKNELAVLGLWHRHPGSMDTFSSTDDLTNKEFSKANSNGVISGLINIDPNFRITMYHVSLPLKYTRLSFGIGDALFPNELLKYKYSYPAGINYGEKRQINSEIFPKSRSFSRPNTIISKFFNSFFKKAEADFFINNDLLKDNKVPKTNKDEEDYLIDLYSNEEIQLENILHIKYKSEVKGGRIIYSVNEFHDGRQIVPPIQFEVNLDARNPIFYADAKEYIFSEGIIIRYVESRLNKNK